MGSRNVEKLQPLLFFFRTLYEIFHICIMLTFTEFDAFLSGWVTLVDFCQGHEKFK